MPSAEYMRNWRSRNADSQDRQRAIERLRHKALRELAKLYPEEFLRIFNQLKREAKLNGKPDGTVPGSSEETGMDRGLAGDA